MATNSQVINSFLNGSASRAGSLTTDGNALFSYNLKIAEWVEGRGLIVYDFTSTGQAFVSQTTSQHVGLIKREVRDTNRIMLPQVARLAGLIR